MDSDTRNYYEILEIPSTASQPDIKTAYTRVKNSYTGDSAALYSLVSQDECNKMLELIEEAYSVLGDSDKRRRYDEARGFNPNGLNERKIEVQHTMKPSFNFHPMEETYEKSAKYEDRSAPTKDENVFEPKVTQKENVSVSKVAALKKFSLDYIVDHQFEQEVDNTMEFSGAILKKVREYKNVTVDRMAELTRVSRTYIRAVEADEFKALPADVYVRGFIYQMAKCLKLNADLVANSYIHRMKKLKK